MIKPRSLCKPTLSLVLFLKIYKFSSAPFPFSWVVHVCVRFHVALLSNSFFKIVFESVVADCSASELQLMGLVLIGSKPQVVLCDLRCACKFDMHEKRQLQPWQWNLLNPVCRDVWVNKLSRWANDLSQYEHWYGRWPEWMRECIFSCLSVQNFHLKDVSAHKLLQKEDNWRKKLMKI